MGSKNSMFAGEAVEEADVMALVKEERIWGVRGEAKPFWRMAILRGGGEREPITRGWGMVRGCWDGGRKTVDL